jgi:hypothetical protein
MRLLLDRRRKWLYCVNVNKRVLNRWKFEKMEEGQSDVQLLGYWVSEWFCIETVTFTWTYRFR